MVIYRASQKKSSPWDFLSVFLGIFRPNFTFLLYVSIYDRLQIFIQLTATLMKLCHIKRDHPVHIVSAKCPPSVKTHTGIFWRFFPSSWEFLVLILRAYYTLLSTNFYSITYNCNKVSLCHTVLPGKCDHQACVSADGRHFEHYDGGCAWHNFVKVAVNWIKFCTPA